VTLDHTKFSLTGNGVIKGDGFKDAHVIVDNTRLENSVLSFALKFSPTKGAFIIFCHVNIKCVIQEVQRILQTRERYSSK